MEDQHPRKWGELTRRIKPQRVPEVGDVWEIDLVDTRSERCLIIGVNNVDKSAFVVFGDGGSITYFYKTLVKYLGKIDLSLLTGEDE